MHEHLFTVKNFVSPMVCSAVANNVEYKDIYEQGILDNKGENIEQMTTIVKRETRYVMCGTKFKNPEFINSLIQCIVEELIEPRFQCTIQYWEWPQLLLYPENGGHYKPHIDSEYYFEGEGWRKISNRDITLLLYLDEGYEGGEVVFPDHNMMIRPAIGQVVAFPSNRNFRHGVLPLTKGTRRVLVCWLSAFGEFHPVSFPPETQHVIRGQYPAIRVEK